jgi:putative copper export protein
MTLDSLPFWLETASKALVYAALLLAIGSLSVRWLLLPRLSNPLPGDLATCERLLAQLALITSIALVAGLSFRLITHTAAAFGFAESVSFGALRVIGIDSRWGAGWRIQMLAALAALSGAFLSRRRQRAGWFVFTTGTLACAVAIPLLGHAAGDRSRVVYHAIHVLGGGFWLGSLAVILFIGHTGAALFRQFAPIALSSAALLAASGTAMTLQYVTSVSDLWLTGYGRTLSLKLMLVAAVGMCGYLNWRYWRAGGDDRRGRLETVEAFLALTVIAVTALLTELEHS